MSFTVSSSVGQTFDVAISEISVAAEEQAAHALTIASDVQSGPSIGAEGGMSMAIGGDATAVGQDTLAVAQISAFLGADGGIQVSGGSADFLAIGVGDPGSYASAYSYVDFVGDADRVVTLNIAVTEYVQEPDYGAWSASSESTLFAMDIDGVPAGDTGVDAPEEVGLPETEPSFELPELSDDTSCGCSDDDPSYVIDGNVAWFDVSAAAAAENTLVTVDLSALTLEDQLSTVTVSVILGIEVV